MTSDPQDLGSPDLANKAWDPVWEVCADLELPVHFHIGASLTAMNFYGQYTWESQDEFVKPAIGGSMLFIGNARVVINTIFSGLFDRFPKLKMVSVESGMGWVPFILEDHGLRNCQKARQCQRPRSAPPSEYFRVGLTARRHLGQTGRGHLQQLVDRSAKTTSCSRPTYPSHRSLAQAPRSRPRGDDHAAPGVMPQDPR